MFAHCKAAHGVFGCRCGTLAMEIPNPKRAYTPKPYKGLGVDLGIRIQDFDLGFRDSDLGFTVEA